MYEPYASKPNYPLLFAVIAAHALAIAYALRPDVFGVASTRAATADTHAATSAKRPPRAQPAAATQAPDDDAGLSDPRREFDAPTWIANAERVSRRQERVIYGDIDEQLAADPAQALDALRRRYAAGDEHADRARFAVAWECSNGDRVYDDPETAGATAQELQGAAPADAELLRRVYDAGRERWNRIKPRCTVWNGQPEEWKAATREFRRGKSTVAQFERIQQDFGAESPEETGWLQRLLAAVDALWKRQPDDSLTRRLGAYLAGLDDAAARERGVALLTGLAERDGRYAQDVAAAYVALQGRPPYDRAAAERWAERAAQLGSAAWIRERADAALAGGDPAAAWAWRAYALWVNAHGCHVVRGSYGETELANALAAIGRIDPALAPAQRIDAAARYRALVHEHGDAALAANDCAP